MQKGIYVALTGATLRMRELEHIASNVANASTDGYKRTSFSTRLYQINEGLAQVMNSTAPDGRSMAHMSKQVCDQGQGTIQPTGNPLNIAVSGEGYLCVDVNGETRYTRNGSFSMDKEGMLINGGGYKVLGTDGKPINLGKSNVSPVIGNDGQVSVEGNPVGTLKLVKLTDVQNVSDSLYSGTVSGTAEGDVKQGALERSNVNPMRELVAMITAQRDFQTIQQMIKSFDQMTSEANQIGKF
jgi:flagellar basal body rod protein FlgG